MSLKLQPLSNITNLHFMQKILAKLPFLDWTVSTISLGYGLYAQNPWAIGGGLLGFAIAYVNPAKRVQARLSAYMLKKHTKQDDSAIVMAEDREYAQVNRVELEQPDDNSSKISSGVYTIKAHPNKHNLLLKPGCLDFKATNTGKWA